MDWLCDREMTVYQTIFSMSGDAAKLDRFERRFAWFKGRLEERKEVWEVFPAAWRVPQTLTLTFCKITKVGGKGREAGREGGGGGEGGDGCCWSEADALAAARAMVGSWGGHREGGGPYGLCKSSGLEVCSTVARLATVAGSPDEVSMLNGSTP